MSIEFNKVRNRDLFDRFDNPQTSQQTISKSIQRYDSAVATELVAAKRRSDSDMAYALIRNIPGTFHSKDLRRYFSDYVENSKFSCFHFRHRPDIQRSSGDLGASRSDPTSEKRCCCVVRFASAEERSAFIKEYHMKFWSDAQDNIIALRCFIFSIKIGASSSSNEEVLSLCDLRSLIELRPPSLMPRGNVGTPSTHFLEQIRLCKLPPAVVGKLGIQSRRRLRKFDAVPLDYDNIESSDTFSNSNAHRSHIYQHGKANRQSYGDGTLNEHKLEGLSPEERTIAREEPDNDEGSDNDKDECEEWERHEAIYDDVTEQDRTKPKKYEEEVEVTWEKGGPGLVWYTDTFYWNQIEQGNDCDWKWADDWDVDYSIYYDRADGTMDAKQAVEIKEDDKLRQGEITKSCFKKKSALLPRKRRASGSDADKDSVFGEFEKHTKGIGSKLMRRLGWKPGYGLGRENRGRVNTVSVELDELGGTQLSGERQGLGYHGEKLRRSGFEKHAQHHIATIYDKRSETGEKGPESVLRRDEPTCMKYR